MLSVVYAECLKYVLYAECHYADVIVLSVMVPRYDVASIGQYKTGLDLLILLQMNIMCHAHMLTLSNLMAY